MHIKSLWEYSTKDIQEQLLSTSLFSEKKLIIIDKIPLSADVKDKKLWEKQEYLWSILDNIPDETIVVFSSFIPDKRWKLYKTLIKKSKDEWGKLVIKNCDITNNSDATQIILNKFEWKIDRTAVEKLLEMKGWNIAKTISEIQKLQHTCLPISIKDIREHIYPEFGESIFIFIDVLVVWNRRKTIEAFNILLTQSDIHGLYYSLIANLRVIVYILHLQNLGVPEREIVSVLTLGNRKFLVWKYPQKTYKRIKNIYTRLIEADKKQKTWKLSHISSSPLKDELETIFITL